MDCRVEPYWIKAAALRAAAPAAHAPGVRPWGPTRHGTAGSESAALSEAARPKHASHEQVTQFRCLNVVAGLPPKLLAYLLDHSLAGQCGHK